jgi:hypothetical protein
MALGLSLVTERAETGAPVVDTENDENVAHIQPDVSIVLGEGHAEGPGTLYVTTRLMAMISFFLSFFFSPVRFVLPSLKSLFIIFTFYHFLMFFNC